MANRPKTSGRPKNARKIAPVMGIKELLSKAFPEEEMKKELERFSGTRIQVSNLAYNLDSRSLAMARRIAEYTPNVQPMQGSAPTSAIWILR